jgi:putative tricarboxylic transport membrane protein
MRKVLTAFGLFILFGIACAGPLDKPECIAGARPGGGFDLTCRLVQSALQEGRFIAQPMRISYMPGGVGAIAYNTIVAQRSAEPNTMVAFSGGTLLNIVQGKFGKYTENDVRWLAAVGADYGVVMVGKDSPIKNLKDLVAALQAAPEKVVFGMGGSVGGQDWMKGVLLARAAGVSHKKIHFVAFDGGGDAIAALQGGHVDVYAGDASEALFQLKTNAQIRVIAVLSGKRLSGTLSKVHTAKEQGFDIEWSSMRGVYMGAKVSDADFKVWTDAFAKMLASREYAKLLEDSGLYPIAMTSAELDGYIRNTMQHYRQLATEFGVMSGR